jgi:hypothetical protein
MHLFLAIACFFRVLFGKRLPDSFPAALLPTPPVEPPRMDADKLLKAAAADAKARVVPEAKLEAATAPLGDAATRAPAKPAPGAGAKDGALQLLGMLQREGRLVDFLRESIDGYDDATVGAAVRDIHRGCKKAVDDHFQMEPILGGAENSAVNVGKGFSPERIRLVGNVKGEPPFAGTLRHHGWVVTRVKLPQATGEIDHSIVAPAEVEL